MYFDTPQRSQVNYLKYPQLEDPLTNFEVNKNINQHLEDFLKDKFSHDFGDDGLKGWPSVGVTREMQIQKMHSHDIEAQKVCDPVMDTQETSDNFCFTNDQTNGLFEGNLDWSSIDGTPSLAFEKDCILSDIDDSSMETWQNMRIFRRKLELQMMMLAKMTKAQKELLKREDRLRYTRHPDYYNYCPAGSKWASNGDQNLLSPRHLSACRSLPTMPVKDVHPLENNTIVPPRDVNYAELVGHVPSLGAQLQGQVDESLKRQWCVKRNNGSFNNKGTGLKSQVQIERCPIQPPMDDDYRPLSEHLRVEVRNIHPTPSLHELHLQYPEVFGKKPIFTSVQYCLSNQRRKRFSVMCQFEFNGAKLYVQETAPIKSDAKLNAARAMIRKLKHTANVSIKLKEESKGAAADTSLEHPKCRLLHLHDSQPDIYPRTPIFKVIKSRNVNGSFIKSRYTNMICYFWVGNDKLTTVGAAHNKKQAIVQAARNMLQLLALPEHNDVNNSLKVVYTPPDRSKTPWTCHFCKIFMTGRKPFLSHLAGRCHNQRLFELGLNTVEENRVLLKLAEMAFEKKQEQKRKTALKNATMKRGQRYKVGELLLEQGRKQTPSPRRYQSSNYQTLVGLNSPRYSEEDSEKSDMNLASSSNSISQSQ